MRSEGLGRTLSPARWSLRRPARASVLLDSDEAREEFYRVSEELGPERGRPASIVVSAPKGGEGSTTVALNLAYAFASGGSRRTLLIDANLRSPALHRLLALPLAGGLADWNERDDPVCHPTGVSPHLSVMTAGTGHEREAWTRWTNLVPSLQARLRAGFDMIIWDAPPLGRYPDALSLARHSDGVVLVVESDRTTLEALGYVREQIAAVGGRILGVLLNRRGRYLPMRRRW